MKFSAIFAVSIFLFSSDINAARCKVDGVWYSYDSPECSPDRPEEPEQEKIVQHEEVAPPSPHPDPPSFATNSVMFAYMRPWDQVVYQVTSRCEEKQGIYIRNRSCQLREEIGYWAMHGNFEMPLTFSHQAKVSCTSKTDSFYSQSQCMQAESHGYRVLTGEFEMPSYVLKEAKTQCLQQHNSLTIIGQCLESAQRKYKKERDIAAGRSFRSRSSGQVRPQSVVGRGEALPGYSSESDIATFIVDPAAQPVVQRVGGDQTLPEPLHVSQRAFYLGIRSADFPNLDEFHAYLDRSTDYFVLTMSEPLGKGGDYLSFTNTLNFNPISGARFGRDGNGVAWLHLMVEEGHTYLVDFVVTSFGAGSYRLAVESNEHTVEDLGGSFNHVTARLKASSSGSARVSLRQDVGNGFRLYAVAVTSALSEKGK